MGCSYLLARLGQTTTEINDTFTDYSIISDSSQSTESSLIASLRMCPHQVPVILDLSGGKGPLATTTAVESTVSSYNTSYSPLNPNIFSINSLTTGHSAATHTVLSSVFTTMLDLSKSTLSSGILSTTDDGNAASPSSPDHVLLLLLSQHEKSKSLWAGPLFLWASLIHQNIQLFWITPLPLHEA